MRKLYGFLISYSLISEFIPAELKYLNSGEEALVLNFIQHRGIRYCIFVENELSSNVNFSSFKKFSEMKVFESLKTEKDLISYITKTKPKYENPNTLIIYKARGLGTLSNFMSSQNSVSKFQSFQISGYLSKNLNFCIGK